MSIHRAAWTGKQLNTLATNWTLPDGAIKPLLNALGPPRTIKAIAYQRRALGYKKQAGASPQFAEASAVGLAMARDQQSGWPIMYGKPAQRERRYLRLLFEGLADERVRAKAKADRVAA